MQFLVKLKPLGAFHIGERGIGYERTQEWVSADTLFSALCSVWVTLFGEVALERDLLNPARKGEPPFLLSSAFPFAGPVHFFPKPLLPPPDGNAKAWKEVRWVSEGILAKWLKGEAVAPEERQALHGGTTVLLNREVTELCEAWDWGHLGDTALWQDRLAPRVTLDATTHASMLFHCGRLIFREGCGLFFIVRFLHPEVVERFEMAIRLMGDEGLGGDRTVGHGGFEPEWSENVPEFLQAQPSQRFITLAPLFPKPEEIGSLLGDGCAYQLVWRTGWVGGIVPAPVRRRGVRMVAEGSVLCGSADKIWGAIADVTPTHSPHPVYRWGFAFPVPCEVNL